jgi:uncharacterized protein
MKILTFVDLHGDKRSLEKLKEKAKSEKVDLIICAGDISVFGRDLPKLLSEFSKLNKVLLIVTGNHESTDELEKASSLFNNVIFLDGRVCNVEDYVFMGYGGGGFAMQDKVFKQFAKVFKKKMQGLKSVLILHGPPYGTKLDKIHGEHVGNKDYTDFIKDAQPDYVICGHLHDNVGKEDKIGKSIMINPGWEGKIIEL